MLKHNFLDKIVAEEKNYSRLMFAREKKAYNKMGRKTFTIKIIWIHDWA